MTQIDFKVYYRDGSTYVGPPENTPILSVVGIVEFDKNHGRRIVAHGDYYTWMGGKWMSCGYDSMIAYMNEPGWKKYLVGVQLFGEDWNRMWNIMENDPDFPKRTAYYPKEKNPRIK